MPIYSFTDGKQTVDRIVPRGTETVEVNGGRWRRVPVSRIAVTGIARPKELKDEVKRGYYAQENRHGSRFASAYSKDRIRKIWGI